MDIEKIKTMLPECVWIIIGKIHFESYFYDEKLRKIFCLVIKEDIPDRIDWCLRGTQTSPNTHEAHQGTGLEGIREVVKNLVPLIPPENKTPLYHGHDSCHGFLVQTTELQINEDNILQFLVCTSCNKHVTFVFKRLEK